ncbi:hypothetical protein C8R43DRAFT_1111178 [Mycena crocata]|nr:hypothetical protein C8R43DRAFT_1111178 [Mycena crocata]
MRIPGMAILALKLVSAGVAAGQSASRFPFVCGAWFGHGKAACGGLRSKREDCRRRHCIAAGGQVLNPFPAATAWMDKPPARIIVERKPPAQIVGRAYITWQHDVYKPVYKPPPRFFPRSTKTCFSPPWSPESTKRRELQVRMRDPMEMLSAEISGIKTSLVNVPDSSNSTYWLQIGSEIHPIDSRHEIWRT